MISSCLMFIMCARNFTLCARHIWSLESLFITLIFFLHTSKTLLLLENNIVFLWMCVIAHYRVPRARYVWSLYRIYLQVKTLIVFYQRDLIFNGKLHCFNIKVRVSALINLSWVELRIQNFDCILPQRDPIFNGK